LPQPRIMLLRNGFCVKLESLFCSLLSLFPKVIVLALLTWALLGTTTELHLNLGRAVAWPISALLGSLYFLSLYTYFKIILVGPGSPLDFPDLRLDVSFAENSPEVYGRDAEQNETLLSPRRAPPMELLTSHTVEHGETCVRWCAKCHVWKPDRCHHCSTCKRCYLRMDHHCPWFSCCVGFRNHKFFIQFQLYVLSFSGTVVAVSSYLLYDFFATEQYASNKYLSLSLVFLAVLSFAFSICLAFFAGFLIYLVLQNLTTIEFHDLRWNYLGDRSADYVYDRHGKKKSVSNFYDLGARRNWTSVMGTKWWQWLWPVTVAGEKLSGFNSGLNFEVDDEIYDKYVLNLRLQVRFNEQLQEYRERLRGCRNQE
ncbi:zf-DHHC-domain-containing protein, partial [Metschnikowia bicuspidata]